MILRDGNCTSLWQTSVEPYEPINLPDNNFQYDVIIVGGGITGITTALLLQEEGKNCLVLEANNLCFGTTGGTTAHINTLLDTPYTTIAKNFGKEGAEMVANAAEEALVHIMNNIDKYGIPCGFERADAYLFAQDEKQEKELEEILEATQDAGLRAAYTDHIPIPVAFTKAIRVEDQAKFNPAKYVFTLAKAFEKAGGVIVQHCRVTGAEDNGVVNVDTTAGIFTGKALVYATHIPPGVNLLHLRCVPYRSYAMAVTLERGDYPKDLCYDMYDPYRYYRTQRVEGRNYLIAGGYDHKTAHEENQEYCFQQLESYLRKHFDIKKVHHSWSSQYFESADGLPYIGHLPGHPGNIYVATGFGGNGMTYSNVSALLLRKMLMNEESEYIKLFDPNRVKPLAGFVNFIKHNADVVKQFVGKWFSGNDLEELAGLAPGEGRVVTLNGEKIALYKSEEGVLHAVNPTCTHLKCEVKWNNAEKTWDCPCHGARYDVDGHAITGPADRDLEIVEIRSLIEK